MANVANQIAELDVGSFAPQMVDKNVHVNVHGSPTIHEFRFVDDGDYYVSLPLLLVLCLILRSIGPLVHVVIGLYDPCLQHSL